MADKIETLEDFKRWLWKEVWEVRDLQVLHNGEFAQVRVCLEGGSFAFPVFLRSASGVRAYWVDMDERIVAKLIGREYVAVHERFSEVEFEQGVLEVLISSKDWIIERVKEFVARRAEVAANG